MSSEEVKDTDSTRQQSSLADTFQFKDNQKLLYDWLLEKAKAPYLAEIYKGAAIMCAAPVFPGRSRFIAHAMREIINHLPDHVGEKNKEQVQYVTLLKSIVEEWDKEGIESIYNSLIIETSPDDSPEPTISLSYSLIGNINNLITQHKKGSNRRVENVTRMVETLKERGAAIDPHNAKEKLLEISSPLPGWAHDQKTDQERAEKVMAHFSLFEDHLIACFLQFFEKVEVIDSVLQTANS